jgi:hypothetical protein
VKTFLHLWQYLAEFFLEWEIFQIKVVEKIKTHILCSVILFPKIVPFMRQCRKIWWSQRGRRQNGSLAVQPCTHRKCNTYCFSSAFVNAPQRYGTRTYIAPRWMLNLVVREVTTGVRCANPQCCVLVWATFASFGRLGANQCYSVGTRALSLRINRPGRDALYCLPVNAEVKDDFYTVVCLRDIDNDSLILP